MKSDLHAGAFILPEHRRYHRPSAVDCDGLNCERRLQKNSSTFLNQQNDSVVKASVHLRREPPVDAQRGRSGFRYELGSRSGLGVVQGGSGRGCGVWMKAKNKQ